MGLDLSYEYSLDTMEFYYSCDFSGCRHLVDSNTHSLSNFQNEHTVSKILELDYYLAVGYTQLCRSLHIFIYYGTKRPVAKGVESNYGNQPISWIIRLHRIIASTYFSKLSFTPLQICNIITHFVRKISLDLFFLKLPLLLYKYAKLLNILYLKSVSIYFF